jgi:hypothetical protein
VKRIAPRFARVDSSVAAAFLDELTARMNSPVRRTQITEDFA